MIQILGWIWGLLLKLGQSEILCLLDDVILFVCVCLWETKSRKSAHGHRLVFRVRFRLVPATEGAVSRSGSINLSAYPSKKSSGAPGNQNRALARAQRAYGDPAGAKYTQLYADMKSTQRCTYPSTSACILTVTSL